MGLEKLKNIGLFASNKESYTGETWSLTYGGGHTKLYICEINGLLINGLI